MRIKGVGKNIGREHKESYVRVGVVVTTSTVISLATAVVVSLREESVSSHSLALNHGRGLAWELVPTASVGVTRVFVVRHCGLIDKALFEVSGGGGMKRYLNANRLLYLRAQRIS